MKKLIILCVIICSSFLMVACHSLNNDKNEASAPSDGLTDISYVDSGFSNLPIKATLSFHAMDTLMTLTVYTNDRESAYNALTAAKNEVERLDRTLSTNNQDSDVFRLNKSGKGVLGPDSAYLMQRSIDFFHQTNGIFDIAIYPILSEWGFTKESFKVPDSQVIKDLLPISRLDLVKFSPDSGNVAFSSEKMGIDYGGIAKGYTSGRLINIFKEHGIESAIVNLGGNVHVLNKKPDGSQFVVGIENPENAEEIIGTLNVENRAVITSGAYQRFFEKDGVRYHHIIDPRTGSPSNSDLTSVTIVSDDGTLADAYSTTLYILGLEKAKTFWQTHKDKFDMVLIDKSGQIYCSSGLASHFKPGKSQKPATIIY